MEKGRESGFWLAEKTKGASFVEKGLSIVGQQRGGFVKAGNCVTILRQIIVDRAEIVPGLRFAGIDRKRLIEGLQRFLRLAKSFQHQPLIVQCLVGLAVDGDRLAQQRLGLHESLRLHEKGGIQIERAKMLGLEMQEFFEGTLRVIQQWYVNISAL